jgi:hypothetical protein
VEEMRKENERKLQQLAADAKAAEEAVRERAVQKAKQHIIERILTLSCPRCDQAFANFDGCWALACSRQGCGCRFCALCLKDCGSDAHAHVAECAGTLYGSMEEFQRRQKERQRKLVKEYLASLKKEYPELLPLSGDIRKACAAELADLNNP